jgi:hypothetical protein
MPDDKIKLPRSSYEELCKIIKAYGRLTQPASLVEVSSLCAMGKTAVSANNSFLVSIELIEGGRLKLPTTKGKDLAQALEHGIPEPIEKNWARVVKENEFLEKMGIAVKIRVAMDSSALEAHIAYSAGEAKSRPVMTGARAVVDILRAAGVIRELDGQLVTSESQPLSREVTDLKSQETSAARTGPTVTQMVVPQAADAPISVSLRIDLRIDAKPDELDGLGRRIRDLMQDLQVQDETLADTDEQNT